MWLFSAQVESRLCGWVFCLCKLIQDIVNVTIVCADRFKTMWMWILYVQMDSTLCGCDSCLCRWIQDFVNVTLLCADGFKTLWMGLLSVQMDPRLCGCDSCQCRWSQDLVDVTLVCAYGGHPLCASQPNEAAAEDSIPLHTKLYTLVLYWTEHYGVYSGFILHCTLNCIQWFYTTRHTKLYTAVLYCTEHYGV